VHISTFVSKDAFVFCIATVKVANHSNLWHSEF
jgi:hypothetical protein